MLKTIFSICCLPSQLDIGIPIHYWHMEGMCMYVPSSSTKLILVLCACTSTVHMFPNF
jgi:hypothetical protein